ncbi:ThuA domain-containing protein [Cellulomonas sp. URHB0016]
MPHALVLVGRGRYEDPWHDHVATSQVLASLLEECGWTASLRGTFPDALDDVTPDLLVVNAGTGRVDPGFDGADDAWAAFHDRRTALMTQGVPVLAVHQASMTFEDDPRWAATLGGRWVDGTSWHPPLGDASFRVVDPAHPVTADVADGLHAVDESYLDLELSAPVQVLAVADHDGTAHPVVWARQDPGRVVYSALGHDLRSYASPSHRTLLRSAIGWLAG